MPKRTPAEKAARAERKAKREERRKSREEFRRQQEEQWRQVKELIWKEAYKTVSSWFCWCSFDCCGKVEGIPLDEYETDFESDSEEDA